MKSNKIKRLLATTLAATLMMATTITAAASGGSGGSAGVPIVVEEEEAAPVSEAVVVAEENNDGGSSAPETSTVVMVSSDAKITVAGTAVKTTVAGAYDVKTVQGAAVTTPAADIKANLGLAANQTPYIMVFDTNPKKSNLAMACVNAAATALNGTAVATLNVDLGAKQNGKIITLSEGSVGMVVGLPKNADTSKQYSIVCVQPGGVVTILEDKDASPATVTFEVKAGLGTYGIVAR